MISIYINLFGHESKEDSSPKEDEIDLHEIVDLFVPKRIKIAGVKYFENDRVEEKCFDLVAKTYQILIYSL